MKNTIAPSTILMLVALTGTWALNACARENPDSVRLAAVEKPASTLDRWQSGTHFAVLPNPQRTQVKPGKVEVSEVFWYGCGHCYALDPVLASWQQNKPAFVEFVRIPVMWGPAHQQHAKLYYTLLALNRADLHPKVFDAIHKQHNMLAAENDADARALHLAFFKEHGVSEKDFNTAYDSMTVAAGLQRAHEATYGYGVTSVPLMIVGGKYSTDVTMAGGPGPLMELVDDLAASEKR